MRPIYSKTKKEAIVAKKRGFFIEISKSLN